jgi:CRP-like cAMP-binding protein
MNQYDFFRQFHELPHEDYQLLTRQVKPKAFKKGHILIYPGEVQKELYLVKSGVQMSYFESDSKSHVIAFTYPPGVCAIPASFSLQSPSEYTLYCVSDSEFDCLSFDQLQKLFDQSQQIERLFRRMTEAILCGLISRHIELHTLSIEERFRTFCQRSPHLLQLVPHKYIASYLGIDASNFSKLFNSIKI